MRGNHQCWMKPVVIDEPLLARHASGKFLFFDFETFPSLENDGVFVPNLAVAINHDNEQFIFPDNIDELGRDITGDLCEFIF